jgi:hypothetical protein
MKSYLSDCKIKDGWGKEDYIYCYNVKVKTGTRNLKIDRNVRGVERRMHPVSRGEEEKILICH